MSPLEETELELDRCIREKDIPGALHLLIDLVTTYAQKKDFARAEKYRDMLYDIDAMALSEIIQANEIIDAEKSKGISQDNQSVWADLYTLLTPDEKNALYYAMTEAVAPPDKYVLKQGENAAALYFVHEGDLRIITQQGGRDILITTLAPGCTFGEESFFSESLSTYSVLPLSPARIGKLDKAILPSWDTSFPGLKGKLESFCHRQHSIPDLLRQKGMDRRVQVRERVSGKAVIQLLAKSGDLSGKPFWGSLFDVSKGGLSFLFRMPNPDKASLLLGRSLVLQLSSERSTPPFKIQKRGIMVAVCPQVFEDYSFHVKFDTELSEQTLQQLIGLFKASSSA